MKNKLFHKRGKMLDLNKGLLPHKGENFPRRKKELFDKHLCRWAHPCGYKPMPVFPGHKAASLFGPKGPSEWEELNLWPSVPKTEILPLYNTLPIYTTNSRKTFFWVGTLYRRSILPHCERVDCKSMQLKHSNGFEMQAFLAQLEEHRPSKSVCIGSNPIECASFKEVAYGFAWKRVSYHLLVGPYGLQRLYSPEGPHHKKERALPKKRTPKRVRKGRKTEKAKEYAWEAVVGIT